MKTDKELYDKVVEAIRKSVPEMQGYQHMEDEVMDSISRSKNYTFPGFVEFLFAWINIGWVRKSLVAASFALLGFFILQQNSIMQQIDELNSRVGNRAGTSIYDPSYALEKRQELIELSGKTGKKVLIPESDLEMLIDSLENMNIRYKGILEIINDDPELKKIFGEKIDRNLQSRFKL